MTEETLDLAIDKFVFRFPTGLRYSDAGIWVKFEGRKARFGLSDFTQQRNGDVAFVEVKDVGTSVRAGEEMAVVETVKVNLSIPSPLSGTVVEINAELQASPELVNQDPYGKGWLAVLEIEEGGEARHVLKTAEESLAFSRGLAEKETQP